MTFTVANLNEESLPEEENPIEEDNEEEFIIADQHKC